MQLEPRLNLKFQMALTEVSANKSFEGWQKVYSHESKELGCTMKFGVYLPAAAAQEKLPVIYWLSGLTCSEANFIEKAGAQRFLFVLDAHINSSIILYNFIKICSPIWCRNC